MQNRRTCNTFDLIFVHLLLLLIIMYDKQRGRRFNYKTIERIKL